MSGVPPTFSVSDRESGTIRVWSGALQGCFDCEELKKAIPFKRHCIHGHMDREIWTPKPSETVPPILNSIAAQAAKVMGHHEFASRNYANYYQNGTSHTFTHRDFDCNPGEVVTLICFGAERILAWGDCCQAAKNNKDCGKDNKKYCLIPLRDGSIVQFDGLWNILHYHKVLKETLNDDGIGPRLSIQWFESRDQSKWSEDEQALWHAHGPNQKHVQRLKRSMVRDLETKVTHKEQLKSYIPSQLPLLHETSNSCNQDEHSSKRLKKSE